MLVYVDMLGRIYIRIQEGQVRLMENQMDNQMESKMQSGGMEGFIGIITKVMALDAWSSHSYSRGFYSEDLGN